MRAMRAIAPVGYYRCPNGRGGLPCLVVLLCSHHAKTSLFACPSHDVRMRLLFRVNFILGANGLGNAPLGGTMIALKAVHHALKNVGSQPDKPRYLILLGVAATNRHKASLTNQRRGRDSSGPLYFAVPPGATEPWWYAAVPLSGACPKPILFQH